MKDSREKNLKAGAEGARAEKAYTMRDEVSCSPEFSQGCVEADNER